MGGGRWGGGGTFLRFFKKKSETLVAFKKNSKESKTKEIRGKNEHISIEN